MDVDVLLFGPQAQQVGARQVRVQLAEGATVAALRVALGAQVPALQQSIPSSRVAVNRAFAPDDAPLTGGDEVALLAAMNGG